MRCRDAKEWLDAQRTGAHETESTPALREHFQQCSACRMYAIRHRHSENLFVTQTTSKASVLAGCGPNISTDRIMQAVRYQHSVTEQLEDIRQQQQTRIKRLRPFGAASFALSLFTLSSIPLFFVAILLIHTDFLANTLLLLSGTIDICIILVQYFQEQFTLLTRNSFLLSVAAFAVIVMTGMWLRLMRHPQEA